MAIALERRSALLRAENHVGSRTLHLAAEMREEAR
jgi:hypothetical protein